MQAVTGVLLVNLGTPDSYRPRDVYRYLIEFLTDARVVDFPWWKRQLLVRGVIVPFRYRNTAKLYESIWTEGGSPLLCHGNAVEKSLQDSLGESFAVKLAMRYQNPSIAAGLDHLRCLRMEHLIILPLFPHYASASTGSVQQKVMEYLQTWEVIPKMTLISSFPTHPGYIDPLCEIGQSHDPQEYDHVIFSFHGIPQRQVKKACRSIGTNHLCYIRQCCSTANTVANRLKIPATNYSVAFQSRLGRDPWIQPYTTDILKECVKNGKKRVLVFCPSFVCDCLETISEIGIEYRHEFKEWGGEQLDLVGGLNSHPSWIKGLKQIILDHM
jgi:protoporphyrin/coproporphyrin ferrochelatase